LLAFHARAVGVAGGHSGSDARRTACGKEKRKKRRDLNDSNDSNDLNPVSFYPVSFS
jgi:hypothetical protein